MEGKRVAARWSSAESRDQLAELATQQHGYMETWSHTLA